MATSQRPSVTVLHNHIAERRKSCRMTQEQLSHALGVSFQRVGQWERGEIIPRVDIALEIARVLACRMEDLFTI